MDRGPGASFIGFGLVLIIAGALMRFAITVHTDGFNINTGGVIAMVVGLAAVVLGLVMLLLPSRRKSITSERYVETPVGQERVQERDDISGL